MVFLSAMIRCCTPLPLPAQRTFLKNVFAHFSDSLYVQKMRDNISKRGECFDIGPLVSAMDMPSLDAETELELINTALKIPNWTHPNVPVGDASKFNIIRTNESNLAEAVEETAEQKAVANNWLRLNDVGLAFGPKSYVLNGPLSLLESVLINYTISKLVSKSFQIVHVPELINSSIINGCGFPTESGRSQVYKLGTSTSNGDQICLAGTAEMSLGGYLSEKCLPENVLPLRLCAISRCFRAEASENQLDKGLYRVHQFNKVEMFVVSRNNPAESDKLLHELASIQEEICQDLELNYRLIEIPSMDLGLPAYRKFDIEAWLPGHNRYGEITSTSNCTDWQSSRLGICWKCKDGSIRYTHTLNGTALAVPRVLIALLETHMEENKFIVPKVLQKYCGTELLPLARCWRSSPAQPVPGILDSR